MANSSMDACRNDGQPPNPAADDGITDKPGRRKRLKSLRRTISVVVILAVLVSVLFPVVRKARRNAIEQARRNNTVQIALALLNYESTMRFFPRAIYEDKDGWPLSSWRFRIYAYLESCMRDIDFNGRWDGPANRILSPGSLRCFCWTSRTELETNIVAITGPGTAWDSPEPVGVRDLSPGTILAMEIADSGIHWMEPGDVLLDELPESIVCGVDGAGVHVIFADGSAWQLRPDTPIDVIKTFCTIEGAKNHDRDQVLGPYAIWQYVCKY